MVKEYEVENDVGPTQTYSHRSSSAVQGLVHATAKVFHKEGSGVPQELKVYLKLNGIEQNIVHYFVGERFHVYFQNGGAVYYVAPIVLEFLNKVWGKLNQLLQAVDSDIKNPVLLDGCWTLGLLGKQVTGPWLRHTMVDRPVLQLNPFYESAVNKLQLWSSDASELMRGEGVLFQASPQKDAVLESLTRSSPTDDRVKSLLEKMCVSVVTVAKRQLQDQLPGGKFCAPSPELENVASSCASNNISGERVFARLDAAIKRAPNASMDYHESKICFSENTSAAWLCAKSPEGRSSLIRTARKQARIGVKDSRIRQEGIFKAKAA